MNHLLAETSEATPVTTDRPNLEDGYRLPLFDARSSGFGDIEPSGDVSPVLVHRFQTAAEVLGWLAFVLGLVVLVVGWWMGVDTVASVVPGSVTMKANTAVGIGAAGLAIVAHRRAWPLSLPIAMAALVTVIGWVTTFEYLTGFGGSGFDELLVREGHGAIATSNPGRMGANTAFDYALLGPALFMLALRRGRRTRQLFAASIATVGFVALLGYTVGVAELAGHLAGATKMAINTSVLHIALGLGVLFSHPDVGVVRPVVSKRVGGNIIRTHLPVALGAAMLIGALAARVIGPMTQDPASSLQLTVAILIAGAAFMVFGIGRRVDRLDAEAEVYRLQQLAAGKALRQSERELDTTFDFAPIGMSLSSRGGRLVRVNPALCDMLGYTAEQLLSMNWRDLTHPADIALNEAEHQRLQESDSPPSGTVEKRYLRSNGEVIWVLLSLAFVRDEAGDPVYSIAHSVDITERKMRETSRAADAERRFRIAFENAPIAMCLTDPTGDSSRSIRQCVRCSNTPTSSFASSAGPTCRIRTM
jgi:PAS domain S-box-containing protein